MKWKRKDYYLRYTLLFAVFMGVITTGYAMLGKSFIWGPRADGMRQHYISLAYFGDYLREILKNLFINHRLDIPTWDLHIGYGSDIVTTLHYYVIGDPLNVLSVFVPEKYTEYLYEFLLALRIYLTGISFSAYSRYHENDDAGTLFGAVMYAFSGWVMVTGFKHPFFINPCIYFPLLILGVDKILKKEKPYLYMAMVGISAVSNFYFFYMIGILMVIYAVYRYIMIFGKIRIKEVLSWLGTFAGYSVVGVMASCAVFLPSVMALMGTERVVVENDVASIYPVKFYYSLPTVISGKTLSRFTIISLSSVVLLGLLVLFVQRKKNTALKTGFIMCVIFACIPFVGHALNGFSYATNRWIWALGLLICYIFAKVYRDIFTLSRKQKAGVLVGMIVYCLNIILNKYARNLWNILECIIFVVITVITLAACDYLKARPKLQASVMLVCLSCGILVNMEYCMTKKGNDSSGVTYHISAETAYKRAYDPIQRKLSKIPDITDYRYEQENTKILYNSSMLTGLNGGQFFFSLSNGHVTDFFDKTYSNCPEEQRFANLDGRAYLMKLLSMKYFVGRDLYVPYGYEKIGKARESRRSTFGIYEDKNALPMAYTYDAYIPEEEFDQMNLAQRQQAMMQGAVMKESSLPECTPEDDSVSMEYEITDLNNVEVYENRLKALTGDASCVLRFKGLPESETFVAFKNLQYLEVNRRHQYSDQEWDDLSLMQKYTVFRKDQNVSNELHIFLGTDVDGAHIDKNILAYTSKNNFYGGRKDFASSLGYHKDGVTEIKVTFKEQGSYQYDDLSVFCMPLNRLDQYSKERKADPVEDLTIEGSDVSCRVSLDQPRALVFSLPYGRGWSAVVDGEETEIKKANIMFMALELDSGEHQIALHYTTPYLKLGAVLSLFGILAFMGIAVKKRREHA